MELNDEFIAGLEIGSADLLNRIAGSLSIRASQAAAVVELTAEGCTVPFISRYRKERTGEPRRGPGPRRRPSAPSRS